MNKIIFVCYDHGAGGERLSFEISKLPFCEPLPSVKHGLRTFTSDYFNKLFLKVFDKEWMNKIPAPYKGQKYIVVPSHYSPKILKQHFQEALFVVINSPNTEKDKKILFERIFSHVWQSTHDTLAQRVGYFIQNSNNTMPTRKQLKVLNKRISNGEIQCLINGIQPTDDNIRKLFKKYKYKYDFDNDYQDSHRLVTMTFNEMLKGQNQRIFDWLTKNQ